VESIGAVLPLLYSGVAPQQILDDVESAPIPELHKAMFRWVKRFVSSSWDMTADDTQALRDAGVSEDEIVNWANIACLQTWWVMSADGGGIPLEGNAVTGPAVQRPREFYEGSREGLTASAPGVPAGAAAAASGPAWVGTDQSLPDYRKAANWAEGRYGFVPNLLRATSLRPDVLPRHTLALELLERPQSSSLGARRHAMVRALVSSLNRCSYSAETTRALLARVADEPDLHARVTEGHSARDFPAEDRVVLDFAAKMTRNAYKVTEKDAQSFRDCGLDDEAYVDVLNTVSIQTSFDRLANALGVVPDADPILPRNA
jgi:uncharacterized peroxidase-related enzyme